MINRELQKETAEKLASAKKLVDDFTDRMKALHPTKKLEDGREVLDVDEGTQKVILEEYGRMNAERCEIERAIYEGDPRAWTFEMWEEALTECGSWVRIEDCENGEIHIYGQTNLEHEANEPPTELLAIIPPGDSQFKAFVDVLLGFNTAFGLQAALADARKEGFDLPFIDLAWIHLKCHFKVTFIDELRKAQGWQESPGGWIYSPRESCEGIKI